MKRVYKKPIIIFVLILISCFSVYSKNYRKLILGKWQYYRYKIFHAAFYRNNRCTVLVKFGKSTKKYQGTYRIEGKYLITNLDKTTSIYKLVNITRSLLHLKILKPGSKYKNDFYLRVK